MTSSVHATNDGTYNDPLSVPRLLASGCSRATSQWPLVLVAVLASLLFFVFLKTHLPTVKVTVRWPVDEANAPPLHGPPGSRTLKGNSSIDALVAHIPDVRPAACLNAKYSTQPMVGSTTLIIKFTDYEFYDAAITLSSLFTNADRNELDAIVEVILVDDASTLGHVQRDVDAYVNDRSKRNHRSSSIPIRVIRTGETQLHDRRWPLAIGAEAARGGIAVFVKAGVVFGRGWLTPLIHPLVVWNKRVPSAVESHLDVLHSPISLSYWKTADDLVPVPSWSLAVRMRRPIRDRKLNASDVVAQHSHYRPVPALRGSAFAVKLADLAALGGLFDEKLDVEGGGEFLDLSLRLWTCGNGIMATCSRVGVPDLVDDVRVVSPLNARHLTETWFKDHKALVTRFGAKLEHDLAAAGDNDEDESNKHTLNNGVAVVETATRRPEHCKDVGWYLEAKSELIAPVLNDSTHFGSLQVQTNLCAYVGADLRIDLGDCEADRLPHPDMVFEMTADGKVLVVGSRRCLTHIAGNYVVADPCKSPRDANQIWAYNIYNGELVNEASKQCATHVTDPDSRHVGRQIVMSQQCQRADVKKNEKFKKWNFVLP